MSVTGPGVPEKPEAPSPPAGGPGSPNATLPEAVRSHFGQDPGHPAIDTTGNGVLAASFGGIPGIIYASEAGSAGMPVPKDLFIHAPCEDHCGARVPAGTTMPPGLKVVEMTFEHDEYMPLDTQQRLYGTFISLPPEDRGFVRMYRDDHGDPRVEADHAEGGNEPDPGEYFGGWKVSTALMTCAVDGYWCEYLLGGTPEQRSMGTWSDGVPVTELVIVDDPMEVASSAAAARGVAT